MKNEMTRKEEKKNDSNTLLVMRVYFTVHRSK